MARMSRMKAWLIGVSLAGLACGAQAQPAPSTAPARPLCAPAKLTRMVVRNVSPELLAASAAAQPRTLWRQGAAYLRSEGSPDPARGVQAVVIIAEPDVWLINPASRTGEHRVDPGPDLNVRAPIQPRSPDLPAVLLTLEYGCEAEFVAAHAPRPLQVVAWGADNASLHVATAGEHEVSILMHAKHKTPLMLLYAKAKKPVFAIRYDEYRADLPERPALFTPPDNYKITEAPPPAAAAPAPF